MSFSKLPFEERSSSFVSMLKLAVHIAVNACFFILDSSLFVMAFHHKLPLNAFHLIIDSSIIALLRNTVKKMFY